MFQCRICSENPFATIFGDGAEEKRDLGPRGGRAARRRPFQQRSEEEVAAAIERWTGYVHPRAREYFADPESLREILSALAHSVDRGDDPVLGDEEKCVVWHGGMQQPEGDDTDTESRAASGSEVWQDRAVRSHVRRPQAVFRMVKPGETEESVTYVNRVLAFTFAADDSFDQLMKLPKEPFRMSCNNQLCVHIGHISLD